MGQNGSQASPGAADSAAWGRSAQGKMTPTCGGFREAQRIQEGLLLMVQSFPWTQTTAHVAGLRGYPTFLVHYTPPSETCSVRHRPPDATSCHTLCYIQGWHGALDLFRWFLSHLLGNCTGNSSEVRWGRLFPYKVVPFYSSLLCSALYLFPEGKR